MTPSLVKLGLPRFLLGAAGGVAVGYLAFGESLFRPDLPQFEGLFVALLVATVLTLVRVWRHPEAISAILAYSCARFILTDTNKWPMAIAALVLGLGIFVIATLYDEMANMGYRFGKFLVVGPLTGGVCLVVVPISHWGELGAQLAIHALLFQFFLGLVVGDGVGLGVEAVELILDAPHAVPAAATEPVSGDEVGGG